MAIILYGGTRETVLKQLACKEHDWHGPGIDRISRYNKCTKCFAIERDLSTEKDYFKAVADADETKRTPRRRRAGDKR